MGPADVSLIARAMHSHSSEKSTSNVRASRKSAHRFTFYYFTARRSPSSTEMGGFHPRSVRDLEISTCKLPHKRCTASPLPSNKAPAFKAHTGTGSKRADRFMARAIRRIKSGVERSSPSLTMSVSFAATGCSRHVTIKSTKLSMPTKLRRLLIDPSGRGRPRATSFMRDLKFPLAPFPYTSVGRMMTTCIPVVRAISRRPTSASCLLMP